MSDKFNVLHQFVPAARKKLDAGAWDYLMGAAETETTHKRNRLAIDRLAFRPRVLRDIAERSTAATVLGQKLPMPIILAPIGSIRDMVPGGAATIAKGAAKAGVIQMLSSVAPPGLEEVAAAADGPKIYQLYVRGDADWVEDRVRRAMDAGYIGFCLTVDLDVYGRRERGLTKDYVAASRQNAGEEIWQERFNWKDVERLNAKFDIPFVIKGIATSEDATIAVECGMDAIYTSNHGGRQLDQGRGMMDILPEIVDAVAGRAEIIIDGGFMRGTDVVKALALGATSVGIGRLHMLAAVAAGADGLVRAMEILHHEIDTTLALLGVCSIEELDASYIHAAPDMHTHSTHPAFPLLDEDY